MTRHVTSVHGVVSFGNRAEKCLAAYWLIPVAFFLASIVSAVIGGTVPTTLGAGNPRADWVLSNNTADAVRRVDSDNYLDGLARVANHWCAPDASPDLPGGSRQGPGLAACDGQWLNKFAIASADRADLATVDVVKQRKRAQ